MHSDTEIDKMVKKFSSNFVSLFEASWTTVQRCGRTLHLQSLDLKPSALGLGHTTPRAHSGPIMENSRRKIDMW